MVSFTELDWNERASWNEETGRNGAPLFACRHIACDGRAGDGARLHARRHFRKLTGELASHPLSAPAVDHVFAHEIALGQLLAEFAQNGKAQREWPRPQPGPCGGALDAADAAPGFRTPIL